MMAAMTRLMSLLSNKRGNKPDQDEIILQKILNKLWLLLLAIIEPLLLNSFDKTSDCLCEFCIGSLLAFCPPALCFSSFWLASSSTTAYQTKTIFCKKGNVPKIYDIFCLLSSTALCFSSIWLGTGWTTAIPGPDQCNAVFLPKGKYPLKISKIFSHQAFVSPQFAMAVTELVTL